MTSTIIFVHMPIIFDYLTYIDNILNPSTHIFQTPVEVLNSPYSR